MSTIILSPKNKDKTNSEHEESYNRSRFLVQTNDDMKKDTKEKET